MNIEIFYKLENKIKDLLTQFEHELIGYQEKVIIIKKLVFECEQISNYQMSISKTLSASRNELFLTQIYQKNDKSGNSDFESIYQNIEILFDKHKLSQDENTKTIRTLNDKLNSVNETIRLLEIKVKHSSKLLSYFDTFYSDIIKLEILDDYRFCPPMNNGYDFKNRKPITLEWVDQLFEYSLHLITSEKRVIEFSNNHIKTKDQSIKLNNKDLAYLLSIIKCFNLRSQDLQLDYLIIPNQYQENTEIDFLIDSTRNLNIQHFYGKIYTEEFNVEWNGKFENAPIRIKMLLNFIFLNFFN